MKQIKKNIYHKDSEFGIINKIKINNIYKIKKAEDILKLSILSKTILKKTNELNKSEFARKCLELFDFEVNSGIKIKEDHVILIYEFNFLKTIDAKEMIINLIENIQIDEEEFLKQKKEYILFYSTLADNKSEQAKYLFKDMHYKDELKHLKYNQVKDELEKLSISDLKISTPVSKQVYIEGNIEINEWFEDIKTDDLKCENFSLNDKCEEYIDIRDKTKQCVLMMSYMACEDVDKYELLILNSIFGSSTYSKLFRNVREKENICYTVRSSIENNKYMSVFTEVAYNNLELATKRIVNLFEEIQDGNIEFEFELAKIEIKNMILKYEKNFSYLENLNLEYKLKLSEYKEVSEILEKIEKINKDDIINLAKKFKYKKKLVIN